MALTDKQRRFVDAKVRGASNKDAAEAAGYAAATASAAGSRLAKNPDILAELERRSRVKGRARKAQAEPSVDDPPADEQEGDEDNGEQLANLPHTNDP
ncbi:terminase small subunit, partial [Pseudomonas aeruginosa]